MTTAGPDMQVVRRDALPLLDDTSLDPLLARIGDASCVLLGAASDGTAEYHFWRAALTRRLIEEKGFSFVATEGDWPECQALHTAVTGAGGGSGAGDTRTVEDAVRTGHRWPSWLWANAEALDFAQWLRRHNERRTADDRTGFFGVDIYSLRDSLHAVLEWLRTHAPEHLPHAVAACTRLQHCGTEGGSTEGGSTEGSSTASNGTEGSSTESNGTEGSSTEGSSTASNSTEGNGTEGSSTESNNTASNNTESSAATPAVVGLVPEKDKDACVSLLVELHHSRLAALPEREPASFAARRHIGTPRAGTPSDPEFYYRSLIEGGTVAWNAHTTHMADVLERLLDYHGSGTKAVVWTHNTQVGDARGTEPTPSARLSLGRLLRERRGTDDTVLVGFGSGTGTVTAADRWAGPAHVRELPRARAGSLEDRLHHSLDMDAALFLVPAEQYRPGWMRQLAGHRAIGPVYRPERESWGVYLPTVLGQAYDAFLYLDRTSALTPLHGEEPAGALGHEPSPDSI